MSNPLERLTSALSDRYAIERELGAGGMATVYLADDLKHERQVAVKVLRPELAAALGPDRFLREIKITAGLNHPHILTLLDSGEADGFLYYVMPYVEGESLRDRLNREKQLDVDDALKITEEVADALNFAHSHDVVHRDIKPENILLSGGHAVVADFGIARAVTAAGGERLTQTGLAVGTPHYMSPEQASAEAEIDGRSDVYSLGCVLYEMLAGEPPYTGPTAQAIMAKRLATPVPSVRTVRDAIPVAIDEVLTKALAKVPADRFQLASTFAEALTTGTVVARVGGRRWPRRGRVAAAALAVTLAGVWVAWQRTRSLPPPTSSTLVAVLPWIVRGNDPELAYLEEGMVDLLSTKLDGLGELRTVDRYALLSFVGRECGGEVDPACGAAVARRFAAGSYVLGSAIALGGSRFALTASVYRPDGSVVASAEVSGEQANPLPAIDDLARTLFVAQLRGPGARLASVAAVTTESYPALRAYLEGERHYRGGRWAAAAEAFAQAVAADSTFALGWFKLSYATAARGEQSDEVRHAAEQALRYRDRLPERERRLLDPWVASVRGLAAQALEGYRAYLGTYPEDITAWSEFGDIEVHYGPLFGRTGAAAREAFERVLAMEPDADLALNHLSWVARTEGNHREADSLVERWLAVSPGGDLALFAQAELAFSRGDVEAQQRVLEQLRRADDLSVSLTPSVGAFLGDLDAAETLARVATEPSRSAQLRASGHVAIVQFKLARGQRAAAEAKLGDAARLDAAVALEYRALLSALPFVPVERDDLDEIRRELERWDAVVPATPAPNPWVTPHEGLHHHLRAYLLGVLNARLGDGANAARYADSLDAMPSPPHAASLAANLAHSVRAHIAWAQERAADALAALEQIRVELTFPYMHSSPFTNHVLERFLRAEALNAVGRHEEALRWYQSVGLWTHSTVSLPFIAPSHLGRAEIYERLGDNAQAVEHYTRFLDLWKDADPELQPTVRDVRQRLAKLVGER